MIRENGGWDMFKMLEVEKFPCNDDREACAEEDKIMKEMKASMNTISAILDKEKVLNNRARYYEDHKDKIIEYKQKYYEEHKEQKIEYYKNYCEQNKEMLKEKRKKYYNENLLKMKERDSEICQCQCGCFLTRKVKGSSRHIQSQRHKNGMKTFAPKIV